tara:strand:+ start:8384 stop:9091 length:708 start_codon:yes stop_codon:yes gene_type:complete
MNTNGRIIAEGTSPYDGAPIVLIVTGFDKVSANDKTGSMLQSWILRTDVKPNEAFKDERGKSVCGNCPHHGSRKGSCYVRWYHAPLSVWNCYKRGNYPHIGNDWHLFDGHALRMGSAGDPAMFNVEIWRKMLNHARTHTGYTHQWREAFAQEFRGIVQASCEDVIDKLEANFHDWKTFLVKHESVEDPTNSVHCMASIEKGQKTNCATCGLCSGSAADVVINAHGATANRVLMEV